MHCRLIDTICYYNGTVPCWVTRNKIASRTGQGNLSCGHSKIPPKTHSESKVWKGRLNLHKAQVAFGSSLFYRSV